MRVIRDETVVAKKDHICQSGFNMIKKGLTYNRTTIVNDGEIYTWKQCMMCKKAMGKVDNDHLYPEERYPEGWAKEYNVGCGETI